MKFDWKGRKQFLDKIKYGGKWNEKYPKGGEIGPALNQNGIRMKPKWDQNEIKLGQG